MAVTTKNVVCLDDCGTGLEYVSSSKKVEVNPNLPNRPAVFQSLTLGQANKAYKFRHIELTIDKPAANATMYFPHGAGAMSKVASVQLNYTNDGGTSRKLVSSANITIDNTNVKVPSSAFLTGATNAKVTVSVFVIYLV